MLRPKNAISTRFEKLYDCWTNKTTGKETSLFRWIVKPYEESMIEGFYNLETSEKAKTQDIFLKFTSSFVNGRSYSISLTEELKEFWESERPSYLAHMADKSWTVRCKQSNCETDTFFQNILQLSTVLNINTRIIIYLAPQCINKKQEFEFWLINSIKLHLPKNCCLMVIDVKVEDEPLKNCTKDIIYLKPDLNIQVAFEDVILSKNTNTLTEVFRNHFFKINEAVNCKDYSTVQHLGRTLLENIQNADWNSVRISIWMMMAVSAFDAGRYRISVSHYKSAYIEAEKVQSTDYKGGVKLRILCLMGIGNVYLARYQLNLAVESYKLAGTLGMETAEYVFAMEGFRMAGFCFQKMEIRQNAMDNYRNAFEAGLLLDRNEQNSATFLIVGRQLSSITNQPCEKLSIRRKMTELIGNDWEMKYHLIKQL